MIIVVVVITTIRRSRREGRILKNMMFVCFLSSSFCGVCINQTKTGVVLLSSFSSFCHPHPKHQSKKKETAANFFNHLRTINKEQHAHFIHSYKSRQSE